MSITLEQILENFRARCAAQAAQNAVPALELPKHQAPKKSSRDLCNCQDPACKGFCNVVRL